MEMSRKEKKFPFRDLASPTEDLYKRPHLHVNTSAGLVLQFPATNFLQMSPHSPSTVAKEQQDTDNSLPKGKWAELPENQKPTIGASSIQANTAIPADKDFSADKQEENNIPWVRNDFISLHCSWGYVGISPVGVQKRLHTLLFIWLLIDFLSNQTATSQLCVFRTVEGTSRRKYPFPLQTQNTRK